MTKPLMVPVFLFMAGGCAPLQQAPLVYTSSLVVGLSASTTATETPGFSVTIGVKALDAAYIPVAVSKEAEGDGKEKLKHYEIVTISGQFGEELTSEALANLSPEQNRQLLEAIEASKTFDNQKQTLEKAKEAAARAQKEETDAKSEATAKLNALKDLDKDFRATQAEIKKAVETKGGIDVKDLEPDPPLPSVTDAADPKLYDIQKFESAARKVADILGPRLAADDTALKSLVGKLQEQVKSIAKIAVEQRAAAAAIQAKTTQAVAEATSVTKANASMEAARLKLDEAFAKAKEAFAKLANVRKKDALSVYGSFNTKTDAETKQQGITTSLGAGKVFSTGVASQNLTEAEKIRANATTALAVADCIVRVSSILNTTYPGLKEGEQDQAKIKQAEEDAKKRKEHFEKLAGACRSGTDTENKNKS